MQSHHRTISLFIKLLPHNDDGFYWSDFLSLFVCLNELTERLLAETICIRESAASQANADENILGKSNPGSR